MNLDNNIERLRNQKLFEELVDEMPAIVWIANPDGTIRHLSRRWYKLTGRALGNPTSWLHSVHPADKRRVERAWMNAVEKRQPYEIRLRYRSYGGQYLWHLARAAPIRRKDGQIDYWIGVSVDVDGPTRLKESVEGAAESERCRLARDLHDDLAQRLVAAKIHVELALHKCPTAANELTNTLRFIVQALCRMRDIAFMLRPFDVEQVGLVEALQQLASQYSGSSIARCSLFCNVDALELDVAHAMLVYRVVQESLSNAAKHAAATEVRVRLDCHPPRFRVSIEDDGCGFDPQVAASSRGLGLIGIKERAADRGAALEVCSKPGNGTTINLEFEYPAP